MNISAEQLVAALTQALKGVQGPQYPPHGNPDAMTNNQGYPQQQNAQNSQGGADPAMAKLEQIRQEVENGVQLILTTLNDLPERIGQAVADNLNKG